LTMGCLQMAVIWGEKCEWYGFCPSKVTLSTPNSVVLSAKIVVKWLVKRGCVQAILDVHYLGLELSELRQFQVGGEPKCRHVASDQKSRLRSDGSEVSG
jgi:hypothetical protein